MNTNKVHTNRNTRNAVKTRQLKLGLHVLGTWNLCPKTVLDVSHKPTQIEISIVIGIVTELGEASWSCSKRAPWLKWSKRSPCPCSRDLATPSSVSVLDLPSSRVSPFESSAAAFGRKLPAEIARPCDADILGMPPTSGLARRQKRRLRRKAKARDCGESCFILMSNQ